MAFKTIQRGLLKALQLGKGKKEIKTVTGHIIGVEKPRKAKFKKSLLLQFIGVDGARFNVWSSTGINQQLLNEAQDAVEPAFVGALVRLTFAGYVKVAGRKQPMKDITVEVDTEKRLAKSGKSYQLDGGARKMR